MIKNSSWSWDQIKPALNFTMLVASLGYFVDLYDLVGILITLSFEALKGTFGLEGAAGIVGFVTIVLAVISLFFMEETYSKDLVCLEKT